MVASIPGAKQRNQDRALTRGRANPGRVHSRPIYPAVLRFEEETRSRVTIAEGTHLWRLDIRYRGRTPGDPDALVSYQAPADPGAIPTTVVRTNRQERQAYLEQVPPGTGTIDEWVAEILGIERRHLKPETTEETA